MKELLRTIKGQYYIKTEHKERLEELNIRIGRGTKGIYLIFFSIGSLENFNSEFSYPEDFLIVFQEFARQQNFVHFTTTIDPELVIKSGLVAKTNGFLGSGIYAIHEDDFLNNGIGDNNMNYLIRTYQKSKFGHYTGSSMIVFTYTGPIMTVINGVKKENLVRIMTYAIPEEKVVSVFEETITYTVA
jgi:hypothetical protein